MLRTAILDGTLSPGRQLREAQIAADLGISRSPLREALTRLEEEGLVRKIPFRGAFVAEVSAADIAEIASIRVLVEPYAAELSIEVLRGSARAILDQVVEELRHATEADDLPASIEAHLAFHRLFYEHSGHGILRSLWEGWESKLRLYLTVDHRSYHRLQDITVEHDKLVSLILDGDVERLQHELRHHFQEALGGEP